MAEAPHLLAALLQQGHQGGFAGGLGEYLHQYSTAAAHPLAIDLLAHKHRRWGLLGMDQVGGEVVANATAHQFHRGAERFTFAQVADHVEVARAGGCFEVELAAAIGGLHQIQLELGVAHVAPHRAIAPRIHHQSL